MKSDAVLISPCFSEGKHEGIYQYLQSVKFYCSHCVKSVKIRSFFWSYFAAYGLNQERISVTLRIQPECGKIQTRKNSVFEQFSRSVRFTKLVIAGSSLWLKCLQLKYETSHETPSPTLNLLGDLHEVVLAKKLFSSETPWEVWRICFQKTVSKHFMKFQSWMVSWWSAKSVRREGFQQNDPISLASKATKFFGKSPLQ